MRHYINGSCVILITLAAVLYIHTVTSADITRLFGESDADRNAEFLNDFFSPGDRKKVADLLDSRAFTIQQLKKMRVSCFTFRLDSNGNATDPRRIQDGVLTTSTGEKAVVGDNTPEHARTAAAHRSLPYDTLLFISGVGFCRVKDELSDSTSRRRHRDTIDVYLGKFDTLKEAREQRNLHSDLRSVVVFTATESGHGK